MLIIFNKYNDYVDNKQHLNSFILSVFIKTDKIKHFSEVASQAAAVALFELFGV